jgi:ABC-type transport system substrate-binding protein
MTVDIVTAEPNSAMLVNVNRVYIMPKDAREKMGADAYAKKPVGTGAYKVTDWQPGQHLELQSADTWWRGKAQPNFLTFRFIKDAATRVAELKSGGVDIISNPPVPDLPALGSGDTELLPAKAGRTIIYMFNPKVKPFDDVRVRQAVNFAVDRDGIVKSVLENNGLVLNGPFAPGWLGHDPNDKAWAYDPRKAKELLTQAGYANGLETTWAISSGVFLKDREIAEAVAGQLSEVGIKVNLVPTERAKMQQDAQNGTFEGIISGAWGANYDPDAMLGYYYVGNKPAFLDDTITKFINEGRIEVDPAKRQQIYQQLADYHVDNSLWLYVHAQDELWAKRRDVSWQLFNTQGSKAYVYYFMVPRA